MRKGMVRSAILPVMLLLVMFLTCCVGGTAFASENGEELPQASVESTPDGFTEAPVDGEIQEMETQSDGSDSFSDIGLVTEIIGDQVEKDAYSGGELLSTVQLVKVNVEKGIAKGRVVEARFTRTNGFNDLYQSPRLKVGDRIVLALGSDEDGNDTFEVLDVVRHRHLLWLVIAFVLVLVAIGGVKGLKAVGTLILTVLAILFLLIPAVLRGADPIVATILICTGVSLPALLLIAGFNRKAAAALIGTTGGVVMAGLIAKWVGTAIHLTGLGDEEAQMLMFIPTTVHFDFQGLLFAGIIIGALGAAMDVAVSMASAMFELKENSPDLPGRGLFRSGMNIGRDMMATMSNTLILAYTGGSLHLLLLLAAYDIPFLEIVNHDLIASEVLRAMAGSIGLLLTIPITALAVVFLTEHAHEKEKAPSDFSV